MTRIKVVLPVFDLSCGGGGSRLVEHVIRKLPGVVDVYVNPATEMAYVEYDPSGLTPERIGEAITEAGYKTSLPARVLREMES